MFRWLNHSMRVRGAIFLVAVYAACVVAPAAALAVSQGVLSPHCISKARSHDQSMHSEGHDLGGVSAHVSDDEAPMQLGDQPKGKQSKSKICCGMLCIAAIASESSELRPQLLVSSPIKIALEQYAVGLEANPLNRPPIAL